MTNNSKMSNCGSPDKNYSGANGSGRSSARGARNSVNGKAGARMEAAEESGRGSSAQNCSNSAQNRSGAAQNCSNSAQNCSNSAQNRSGAAQNRSGAAQNCSNSAQNRSGAAQNCSNSAQNCSNSAQNCSNSAQNCSNSATKGATSRMEAAESDSSSSGKALNRYKCKNCGAIHEGASAPKSCMKCDSEEFRKI